TRGHLAGADAYVAARDHQHALCRRHLDLHRLLAVGPAVAGSPGRAGGAVCSAGAVRWLSRLQHHLRRAVRDLAACRHAHRDRRHRHHAAVEASAKGAGSGGGLTMSNQLLLAFIVFAIVMFITPGPNNIMVLSSGLTYGFRRTVPHIAGITIGFAFMIAAV